MHSKFFKSLIGSDALIGIIDEGKERLKTSLTSSYALLILDDAYQVNKFDAFWSYEYLVDNFLEVSNGLPLSLKVFEGTSLWKKWYLIVKTNWIAFNGYFPLR